eukprot:12255931-Ditylum_brightwellii.AAC.1
MSEMDWQMAIEEMNSDDEVDDDALEYVQEANIYTLILKHLQNLLNHLHHHSGLFKGQPYMKPCMAFVMHLMVGLAHFSPHNWALDK